MTPGIRWVILLTDHYQEAVRFYSEILGFPVEREVASEEFCQFKYAGGFLAVYGRTHLQPLLGSHLLTQAGGAIYSFPDSTDIDADYQQLLVKGVTFLAPPATQPWGQRTAYFADPDGHLWELQQWLQSPTS